MAVGARRKILNSCIRSAMYPYRSSCRLPPSHAATHRRLPALRESLALLGFALLLGSGAANAGYPQNWTPAELALAPPYCPDAQTFGYGDKYGGHMSPNAPKWVALMGDGFWAVHHYCWAIINLARAQRPSTPQVERQGLRASAIQDMEYVIKNAGPDFILLPEIYTKIGEVHLLLNHEADARDAFAKARGIKPDYWPAYSEWALYLQRTGHKEEARGIVQEGLTHAPSSKTLRRLLAELGGNPASIRPRGAEATAQESTKAAKP
jgi:tetratricopeptide (TPR) repeat protein